MTDQAQDPMLVFYSAAYHAAEVAGEALTVLAMVREAYNATGPGHGHDGRAETIASAVAMVDAARELAESLWAVVEATRENAKEER